MNTRYSSTLGAFKVPTLRNISMTAPYFQQGQFSTLSEVLNHYNNAPNAPVGHSELTPLGLTSQEMVQIEAFLMSLSSPPAVVRCLAHKPTLVWEYRGNFYLYFS